MRVGVCGWSPANTYPSILVRLGVKRTQCGRLLFLYTFSLLNGSTHFLSSSTARFQRSLKIWSSHVDCLLICLIHHERKNRLVRQITVEKGPLPKCHSYSNWNSLKSERTLLKPEILRLEMNVDYSFTTLTSVRTSKAEAPCLWKSRRKIGTKRVKFLSKYIIRANKV